MKALVMNPFTMTSERLIWICHAAGAGVSILLTIALWYAYQAWEVPACAHLLEQEAALQSLEEAKHQIRDAFQSSQQKAAAAEQAFEEKKRRIPPTLDTSRCLMLLSQTASSFNVDLGDVRPHDHRAVQNFIRHKWRMTARGDFLQLCRFIDAVEHLPIGFVVDELSVSINGKPGEPILADLGVVAHSRKPAPTPANSTAAKTP
jgi:hypothetical protein